MTTTPLSYGVAPPAFRLPDAAHVGAVHLQVVDLQRSLSYYEQLLGLRAQSATDDLWDPDGLGIEVYADRPRHTWQRHDRELAMTTDPLDIQSVIAAGRGEAWAGAPKGTTMGHVHLPVGSLEEAEAFYHRALGFDKTVWTYPEALFMSAGGYHHHLGTNTWSFGPGASVDEARLLEWELMVPSDGDVEAAARSLRDAGYSVETTEVRVVAADPWGTRVHIRTDRHH
jgi:catechol 2,3-dioxygenase